jgi:hypothetical protein
MAGRGLCCCSRCQERSGMERPAIDNDSRGGGGYPCRARRLPLGMARRARVRRGWPLSWPRSLPYRAHCGLLAAMVGRCPVCRGMCILWPLSLSQKRVAAQDSPRLGSGLGSFGRPLGSSAVPSRFPVDRSRNILVCSRFRLESGPGRWRLSQQPSSPSSRSCQSRKRW